MSEENQIDPKEVRKQLQLADDAPDADVIVALLAIVAALTEQNEAMTGAAASAETELANRTLEQYADRIPEGTADFWREQILANREAAVGVLDAMKPAEATPEKKPTPEPLKNRLPGIPARVDNPGEATDRRDTANAAAIRNRAQEIMAREHVSYPQAWERAQAEAAK